MPAAAVEENTARRLDILEPGRSRLRPGIDAQIDLWESFAADKAPDLHRAASCLECHIAEGLASHRGRSVQNQAEPVRQVGKARGSPLLLIYLFESSVAIAPQAFLFNLIFYFACLKNAHIAELK